MYFNFRYRACYQYRGDWHPFRDVVAISLRGRKKNRTGRMSEEGMVVPFKAFGSFFKQYETLKTAVWKEAKALAEEWNQTMAPKGYCD